MSQPRSAQLSARPNAPTAAVHTALLTALSLICAPLSAQPTAESPSAEPVKEVNKEAHREAHKEAHQEATPKPAPLKAESPQLDPALMEKVVGGVQRFYADAQDFQADFHQTFTYKIYQRKKQSTGKVFFKKPALMRWDYEVPHQRLFIADGATLWVYEPEEAQVFKRDLASAQLPVALRFMKGEGKLTDDFNVSSITQSEEGYELSLLPKRPSSEYRELKLHIAAERFNVTASVLIDPVGNSNHITFVDAKVNSSLPSEGFSFTPPEGVRVIGDSL